MGISKYNAEGYLDLTAYEALLATTREAKKAAFRPLVFICSPLAGDVEHNLEQARRYCRFAVTKGAIPLAPHLLFPQFMDDGDKTQRNLAIFMGLVLLSKCHELWCFGNKISPGMAIELEKAKRLGIPVRHFTGQCAEVKQSARG
ncbi:DUF4406 domain-containing protein [Acetivibrio clariflavus]|jgi:hypothetical protein|uniref:DUF7768 domain-containing protein n=1 Tax=Acetivibrio clariflavus TaxID=288965 RepID=UPI00048817E3|nr:DUF4406 domain-containing protein [Acetivibrio clariflavus]